MNIILNQKKDITYDLRSEEIAKSASKLSSKKEVRELLFEPWDPFSVDAMKSEIYNVINRLEPRVVCTGVSVRDDSEVNSVQIAIDYTIVGQQEVQNVDFLLERA